MGGWRVHAPTKQKFEQLSLKRIMLAGMIYFIAISVAGAVLVKRADPSFPSQSGMSIRTDLFTMHGDATIAKPSAARFFEVKSEFKKSTDMASRDMETHKSRNAIDVPAQEPTTVALKN